MSSRPALALAAVATELALTGCSAVSFVGGLVSGPMDAAATYQEMITESGLTRVGSAIWSAGHLDVVAFGDQASPEGTQLARQRGGGTTRTAERGRAYGVMPASALDVAGIDARARAAAPDCSRYLIRADVLPEGTVAVELECQDDDRRYVGFGSGAITPVVPEAPDGTAVRMLTAALPRAQDAGITTIQELSTFPSRFDAVTVTVPDSAPLSDGSTCPYKVDLGAATWRCDPYPEPAPSFPMPDAAALLAVAAKGDAEVMAAGGYGALSGMQVSRAGGLREPVVSFGEAFKTQYYYDLAGNRVA